MVVVCIFIFFLFISLPFAIYNIDITDHEAVQICFEDFEMANQSEWGELSRFHDIYL